MKPEDRKLLKKWGEARALSNAFYGIYKDLRDQEQAYSDQIAEKLIRQYGLSEKDTSELVTDFNRMVNKKGKN